ncbi:Uncharacterized conserved protein [Ceraceosorus bombacis]|uniref:Uncharacterized conserved protein n=1 Tax=Ceraceosorus bombacis TaxID=401625 RepID=A0A0P1B8D0_9BASI|nr:Uncharacterized conserved protein [Ceraceosorus bombacis]
MSRSASSSLDATAGSEQQAYSDWSKSVGGEGSDTWLSFAAWRKAHEEAAAKEREDARKAAKTAKSRTTSALPAQDPPGSQRTTTNASHASTLATSATSAISSAGTVSRNLRADSQAQKVEAHDQYRAQPMNRTTEHAPFDGSPAAMPTFSGILPRPSSPDGGALPAVGNPAAQLATLKHRWNFASLDCAAVVHRSNPSAKFASSILSDKKDRYMLSPCPGVKRQDQPAASAKGESQFVIVELCDEISIDTIVMANFEFFSRMFKRFRVRVARKLYDRDEDWVDIGSFRARNVRGLQVFNTVQPRSEARFFRYLRIDFLEHYGSEFYCPVSLLRVYGLTQMDDYIREEEELRREKEREDAGIFADADVEQEEQEPAEIDSSEDEASQLPSWRGGANFDPEVVATHPAFTPLTRETTTAGRPDTFAAAGGTSESKSSQPGTTSPMHPSNSLVASQSTSREESSDPLETLNFSSHFDEVASSPNMTIASGTCEHNLTATGNASSESSAEAEAIASLPSHTRIGDQGVTEVTQKAASTEQSRLFSSTAMAASGTASDKHAAPVEASQQRSQAETVSIASGLSNVSSLPATSTEAGLCSTSSDDASATSTPPNAAAALPRSPAQLQSEVGDAVSLSHSVPHSTEAASQRLAASSASRSEVVAGGEPALAGPTGESPPPVSSQSTSSMSTAAASPSVSAEASGPINVGTGAGNGRSGPPPSGNHGGGGSGGGSESIYRTITKRLNALEANATLSLQYIEHSTQMLRDVFARMERRQEERMGEMLRALNASNWRQIEGLKRRQQVDLQQAIFEFDVHRQQVDAERGRLVAEMHVLANEVLQEKRFGIVQLMLLLCLFVIMAFTRGSSAAAPLIHSGLARLGGNTPIALQKRLGLHSPLTLTPRRSALRQAQTSPANASDLKQERRDRQSTNDVSDTVKARSHRDRPLLHAVQSLAHGTKGTGRHLVNRRLPGRTVVSAGLKADGGRPKPEDQRRSIPASAVPVRKTANHIYQRGARKRPDLGVTIPSSAGFAEMSREELRAWLEYLSPGSSPAREMRSRVSIEALGSFSQALASKTAPFDAPATAPATDRAFIHSAQPSNSFLHADRPEAEVRLSNDETFSSDWGTERSEDESTAESLSDASNGKAISQQHSPADGSATVAPNRKPPKVFERSDTLTLDNARFVPDNVLPLSAGLPGRSTPTEQVANLSLEASASSPFKSALGSYRAPLSRTSVPLSTWPKSLGSPYLPAESDADDEEVGAESLHWTEVRRSRSISNRKSNARPNSSHSQRDGHITSSSPTSSQSVSASGVTTPNGTCRPLARLLTPPSTRLPAPATSCGSSGHSSLSSYNFRSWSSSLFFGRLVLLPRFLPFQILSWSLSPTLFGELLRSPARQPGIMKVSNAAAAVLMSTAGIARTVNAAPLPADDFSAHHSSTTLSARQPSAKEQSAIQILQAREPQLGRAASLWQKAAHQVTGQLRAAKGLDAIGAGAHAHPHLPGHHAGGAFGPSFSMHPGLGTTNIHIHSGGGTAGLAAAEERLLGAAHLNPAVPVKGKKRSKLPIIGAALGGGALVYGITKMGEKGHDQKVAQDAAEAQMQQDDEAYKAQQDEPSEIVHPAVFYSADKHEAATEVGKHAPSTAHSNIAPNWGQWPGQHVGRAEEYEALVRDHPKSKLAQMGYIPSRYNFERINSKSEPFQKFATLAGDAVRHEQSAKPKLGGSFGGKGLALAIVGGGLVGGLLSLPRPDKRSVQDIDLDQGLLQARSPVDRLAARSSAVSTTFDDAAYYIVPRTSNEYPATVSNVRDYPANVQWQDAGGAMLMRRGVSRDVELPVHLRRRGPQTVFIESSSMERAIWQARSVGGAGADIGRGLVTLARRDEHVKHTADTPAETIQRVRNFEHNFLTELRIRIKRWVRMTGAGLHWIGGRLDNLTSHPSRLYVPGPPLEITQGPKRADTRS